MCIGLGTYDEVSESGQKQWLALVSLHGILVRSLAGRQSLEQTAVGFAVMSHERALSTLALPDIDGASELSLADLKVYCFDLL